MINNMEIKQGDKVRVSKDAPRIYTDGWRFDWRNLESIVSIIENEDAVISPDDSGEEELTIPTKYLVKVDAEAKEAKFKVGDKVKVNLPRSIRHNTIGTVVFAYASGNAVNVDFGDDNEPIYCDCDCLEPYAEPTAPKYKKGDRVKFKNTYELQKVKDKSFRWMLVMFASKEATITAVEDNGFYRVDIDPSIGGINDDMVECKVEPTEQTEVQKNDSDNLKKVAEEWANTVSDAIKEYGDAMCQTYIDAHTEAYWDAYAAELAKEVALKVANKFNDPKETAEYAVSVAQVVVEGLKRK